MNDAYDMIDRFLRDELDDVDYTRYSAALDEVWMARPTPKAAPAEPQQACVWREEDPWGPMPDTYATSCGEMWSFVDGGPAENRVRYCHRCGKPVTVVPYPQPVDEDDADGAEDKTK